MSSTNTGGQPPFQYDGVYKDLVEGSDDLVGAIAYVLYKEQKVAYIESFYMQNGSYPNDSAMEAFRQMVRVPPSIEGFKSRAEVLVLQYLDTALADKVEEFERQSTQRTEARLKDILKPLEQSVADKATWLHGDIAAVSTTVATGSVDTQLKSIIAEQNAAKTLKRWGQDIVQNLLVNVVTIIIVGLLVFGYRFTASMNESVERNVGLKEQNPHQPVQ